MKERLLTAFILIVIVVSIIFFLPFLFIPLIAITLGISIWEWCRIAQIKPYSSYLVATITILLWLLAALDTTFFNILLILSALHYLYAIRLIRNYEHIINYQINKHYLSLAGPVILAALASTLVYIFHPQAGTPTLDEALSLTFIIMVVAAADSGAYFVGRLLGRHRLSPRVSPKKTIEGLIGGLVTVAAVVYFFQFMVEGWYLSLGKLMLISLCTALASVVGDLFISVIKRQNDIKDTSQILPGHGGILDRIDGLIAAVPVFYILQQFI